MPAPTPRSRSPSPPMSTRPWPRDEWIVQREMFYRAYVVHTRSPKFIARVVEQSASGAPDPNEGPVDMLSGIVFDAEHLTFCEIVWIDNPPGTDAETVALFLRATEVYDRPDDADMEFALGDLLDDDDPAGS